MIAVDTSALMAVVLNEDRAAACSAALTSDPNRLISAVTLAEDWLLRMVKTFCLT